MQEENPFELIAKDSRGYHYRLQSADKSKQIPQIFTHAGFLRGGQSHTNKEIIVLMSGKMSLTLLEDGIERTMVLKANEPFHVPINVPHIAAFETDSWFYEIKDLPVETTNYPRWRALVIDKMNAKD